MHRFRIARTAFVTAVIALVAGTGVAQADPAAPPYSATNPPPGCPENNICLYDGENYTGAWNRHACDRKFVSFVTPLKDIWTLGPGSHGGDDVDDQDAEFFKRVSSVFGRCDGKKLWALTFHPEPNPPGVQRWIPGDVSDPDLGNDGVDNANSFLSDIDEGPLTNTLDDRFAPPLRTKFYPEDTCDQYVVCEHQDGGVWKHDLEAGKWRTNDIPLPEIDVRLNGR